MRRYVQRVHSSLVHDLQAVRNVNQSRAHSKIGTTGTRLLRMQSHTSMSNIVQTGCESCLYPCLVGP
jgi:hypothetical protein